MKCKNCGIELQEGAVFCQSCGSKVEDVQDKAEESKSEETKAEETKAEETKAEEPKVEEAKAEETKAETVKPEETKAVKAESEASADMGNEKTQEQAQAVQNQAVQAQAVQSTSSEKKKSKALPIIIAVAAVAVIALLVALFVKVLPKMSGGKDAPSTMAVYISRGTLYYTPDATAKEPKIYEICDIEIDASFYTIPEDLVTISDDEKYIYFFNDLNADACGDLCRIQINKIGKDKDKNEKRIEEIDDNVQLYTLAFLDGGKIAYVTGRQKLCIFDGKESTEIQKNVGTPYLANDGKALVYVGDMDDDGYYTLFYLDLAKTDAEEIEEGVSYINSVEKNGVFFCKTDQETWTSSLYFYSFDGQDTELICDDYSYSSVKTDKGFYYIEHVDSELSLYDFIDDPYARDDENVTEPVSPTNSAGFVAANPGDVFDAFKYERMIKKYGGDPVAYMEDNCSVYTYDDVRYYYIYNSDTGTEYYYDISGDQYYRYDYDAYQKAWDDYYAARDVWYSVQNRISLRQALKDYTFNPGYTSINYYHDGQSEVVVDKCTDVMFAFRVTNEPVAVYHLPDSADIEKVSIDEISYAYEAYERLFGNGNASGNGEIFYSVGGDADHSLGIEGEIDDITYSESDGLFAIATVTEDRNGDSEREVFLYSVKGVDFTLNEKFDDESDCIAAFNSGNVFFIKGMDEYSMEGDLYIYDGKNTTRLIKNVNLYRYGALFESGSILCYKDADAVLFDKNGEEIIKLGPIEALYSDMNYISDKKIIFLADGKLKFYNGKEVIKIAGSVDRVWFSRTGSYTSMAYRY